MKPLHILVIFFSKTKTVPQITLNLMVWTTVMHWMHQLALEWLNTSRVDKHWMTVLLEPDTETLFTKCHILKITIRIDCYGLQGNFKEDVWLIFYKAETTMIVDMDMTETDRLIQLIFLPSGVIVRKLG
jgi:hypothetical protein